MSNSDKNLGKKKKIEFKRIKNFFLRFWPVLLIIVLGTIPSLVWFKDGLLIAGGDDIWYLDPSNYFKECLSAWVDKFNLGAPNIQVHFIFPVVSFWAILRPLGVSLVNIERLWMMLLFILSGLSFYALIGGLFKDENERREIGPGNWLKIGGFVGALLYMFNMYVVAYYSTIAARTILIALPLLLLFWMKGLQEKKFSLKYSLIIGLVFIFLFSAETNVASFGVVLLVLLSYFIFYVFTNPSKKRLIHGLKFSAVVLGLFLVVNFWWLATSFAAMLEIGKKTGEFIKPAHFIDQTHLWEAFRFLGNWSFRLIYQVSNPAASHSIPHVPYSVPYYNNPFLIVFTFFLPFLAFLALILKPKNKNVLFFGFLSIIGLFLTKGANAPLGQLFRYLFDNVSGFWGFRNPHSKFSLAHILGISVLLSVSSGFFYKKLSEQPFFKKKPFFLIPKLIPVFLSVIIFISAFPLFTGKVIQDETWHGLKRESVHVKVPDYWLELSQWLKKNDSEAKVFLLPKTGYGHCYTWESGTCVGDPVARTLLNNPLVYFPTYVNTVKDKLIDDLYTALENNNQEEISSLLELLNIRYVLQQNDVDWTYGLLVKSRSPEHFNTVLTSQKSLSFLRSFGKLELYRVNDEYFKPAIFTPLEVTYLALEEEDNALVDLLKAEEKKGTAFISTAETASQQEFISKVVKRVNHLILMASPNFLTDKIEYQFNVFQSGKYQLFIKKEDINFELVHCPDCESQIKVKFKSFLVVDNKEKGFIRLDGKTIQLQSDLEADDLLVGERPLSQAEVKRLNIVDPWMLVQSLDKNADIYESKAPLPFSETYITKPGPNIPFLVFRQGKLLKRWWEVFPDEVDIVKISSNPPSPRRLFVTVPKGAKPTDDYWILYVESNPFLKEPGLGLPDYEKQIYLGSFDFKPGKHKIEVLASNVSSDQEKTDDYILLLKKEQKSPGISQPAISFQKLSPDKYKVSIKKAKGPFFLVFNQSFHSQWQASFKKGGPVNKEQHFLVAGFLNGWLIEPPAGKENFEIFLQYRPQRFYFLGVIILAIFVVFSSGYLMRKKIWRQRQ